MPLDGVVGVIHGDSGPAHENVVLLDLLRMMAPAGNELRIHRPTAAGVRIAEPAE